jgi:hypothetical protein
MKLRQASAGSTTLQWRIEPAFDDYVRNRTGDGTVILADGASRDSDGFYRFPRTGAFRDCKNFHFSGSVEFRAYLGVLSVRIAEPSLHVAEDKVHMYIVDDSAPAGTRLELASAAIKPGATGVTNLDLRLTERGAELFMGKYPAGTPLAPIELVLPAPVTRQLTVEGAF